MNRSCGQPSSGTSGRSSFRCCELIGWCSVEFLRLLTRSDNRQWPTTRYRVLHVIESGSDRDCPAMQDVVDKWLFAREAEAMGITVDDKTVNEFLGRADQQSLVASNIVKISARHSPGGVGSDIPLDLARGIARLAYRQLFHQIDDDDLWIGGSATPDERWTAFKRLNEQATIEVALFSPQDFTKQVADPFRRNAQAILRRAQAGRTPRRIRRTRASTCRARSISSTCRRMKRSFGPW